jgi:hypothetical protein
MTVPVPGPPPRPVDPLVAVERAVGEAMSVLDGLADRPLGEHVEAFERVHTALSDALAVGSGAGA